MPKTRGAWIALTVLACLIVGLLGWFLVISPQLDEESALADQEKALVAENDTLEARVAALRAQFARIDEFRATLAQLQTRVPTEAQTDDLVDAIQALADRHDVLIKGVTAEVPQSLVGDEVVPAAAPTPEASADATDGAAAPTPAPVPAQGWTPDGPANLVALPYKLDVDGDYRDVVAFLESLQTKDERYVLVTNPVVTALGEDAKSGKELNVVFALFAFVLTDESVDTAAGDEGADLGAAERSDSSPFAPPAS